MNRGTKIIMFMMIAVIIIISIVAILLKINLIQVEKENDNPETVPFLDVERLENKKLFYKINYNINKYIKYIEKKNTEAIQAVSPNDEIILKNSSNSIIVFQSQEMYTLDKISNITVYIYGVSRQANIEEKHYLIVNLDYTNNTFEIINSSKEEYNNAKNNTIDEKYKNNIEIKLNNYNQIEDKNITDFEILKYYFEDYKFKALYNIDEAFEQLDTEYKQKKFNNDINEYKIYVQNNINRFKDANIVKHGIKNEVQNLEYTAIDNFGNYYKFVEKEINSYKIILDNYTLETDEILDKYSKLSDTEKVTSNMDKVMKLINSKSYTELYKYLNENFKNTYFKTQESFEQYIQSNFFENNIVGAFTIENEGNAFIVKVPYKESLSMEAEEAEKTFILKLGEGTDFELSFNVD